MGRIGWLWMAGLGLGVLSTVAGARGDEFDRIEGEALVGATRGKEASPHPALTLGEIDALPNVLRDSRSALLVATTDRGNVARLLVSPALRKAPGSEKEPVPVLVLERFDTFEAGNLATRLARGKDLILFDGFRVDLDAGQVVPEDQGGDLQFLSAGEGGPRLSALGGAKLYTLLKAPIPRTNVRDYVSFGRSVFPTEFAGRYRLFADGGWAGVLDLKVNPGGNVSGSFRSELNGTAYPVEGQVARDVGHKVVFRVKFPRASQDFEGYLWTRGKGALAGTVTMLNQVYGFFAIREGGRIAPEGEDVGLLRDGGQQAAPPGRRTVTVRKGQYTLDGQPRTDRELTESLKQAMALKPETWVLLRVHDDEPFAAIRRAFEVIGAAGVGTIRLSESDETD